MHDDMMQGHAIFLPHYRPGEFASKALQLMSIGTEGSGSSHVTPGPSARNGRHPSVAMDPALQSIGLPSSARERRRFLLGYDDDRRRGEEDIIEDHHSIRNARLFLFPQFYPPHTKNRKTVLHLLDHKTAGAAAPRRSLAAVSQRVKTLFSIQTTTNAAATVVAKLSAVAIADSMRVGGRRG